MLFQGYPDERSGFQHFVLRPYIANGLEFARASYCTMHGRIETHSRREEDRLIWNVRIPPNCMARVFIPSRDDRCPATDGLEVISREGTWTLCAAPAGTYELRTRVPPASSASVVGDRSDDLQASDPLGLSRRTIITHRKGPTGNRGRSRGQIDFFGTIQTVSGLSPIA